MTESLLLAPEGCDECGNVRLLYVRTVLGSLCSGCYEKKGCPMGAALGPIHELEENTRKRMMSRGSATAHLVRKGLT